MIFDNIAFSRGYFFKSMHLPSILQARNTFILDIVSTSYSQPLYYFIKQGIEFKFKNEIDVLASIIIRTKFHFNRLTQNNFTAFLDVFSDRPLQSILPRERSKRCIDQEMSQSEINFHSEIRAWGSFHKAF